MAAVPVPQPKFNLLKIVQQLEPDHETETGKKFSEETHVDLIFRSIQDLDTQTLNSFAACTKLSLSSNFIVKIPDIHLKNLEILSLGRNKIKVIRGLDFVGNTLKQLWISYNEIDKLDGLQALLKLEVFYVGNNNIAKVDELNKLSHLTNLVDVVFKGNIFAIQDGNINKPVDRTDRDVYKEDIRKRIPSVQMIDGERSSSSE